MLTRSFIVALVTATIGLSGPLSAQDSQTHYPADGVPILDCGPQALANLEGCTLQVLPGYEVDNLQSDPVSDPDAEFQFVRPDSRRFPGDLTLSETVLLIDLSPGPSNGRASTFATEKTVIGELIDGLPAGHAMAIYGFSEDIERITGFTSNKDDLKNTIEDLSLGGQNTLIGPSVNDVVNILADREEVLFQSIILISDGDDESGIDVAEIAQNAADNGVVVSTLSTLWRPVGASASGGGIAYMRALAEQTRGISAQAQLQTPADAGEATGDFAVALSQAFDESGLILPVGTPTAATISVTVSEPVAGEATLREKDVTVDFEPSTDAVAETDDEQSTETDDPQTLFGYPMLHIQIAAGVIVGLILLLLSILFTRRGSQVPDVDDDFEDHVAVEDVDDASQAMTKLHVPATPKEQPKASAYLVFESKIKRGTIVGQRVNIGRSKSNEVVIDAEGISRVHAQIYRNRDGGFSIADMDSLNGTYINGAKISGTQQVGLGDIISFGEIRAKLTAP